MKNGWLVIAALIHGVLPTLQSTCEKLGKVAGVNGKWDIVGVIVYISIVSLAGVPQENDRFLFQRKPILFLNSPGVYKVKIDIIKLIKAPLRRPDLAKEYFDSPTDGFPFYQSHLQARFGRLMVWCGQQLKTWNILERRRTHHLYHPEHTFPPLFGWPFCGELISKN